MRDVSRRIASVENELNIRLASIQLQIDQRFAGAEIAVNAALVSAEKAVSKAEVAAEKRFESVNEFRAQLTDQASTFVNRNEAEVRISALAEKLDTETKRNASRIGELELRVASRLDVLAGSAIGSAERRTEARLDLGTIIQVVSVLVAFGAILIVVFHN